jgi:hypothetical protein
VVKAEDNELLVEIARDIRVRIARSVISEVLGKPERAAAFGKNLMSQLFGKK